MLKKNILESAKETKKWLKELSWKKIFLVGLIYTVFTTIIHEVEAVLTMKYYQIPQYFGVWSKSMMPKSGQLIFTFYSGISLALVYYYIKDLLPKLFWKRVFLFADLMIATSFIFFIIPSYLLFNLPYQLLLSWFVSGFVILLLTSLTLVKIIH